MTSFVVTVMAILGAVACGDSSNDSKDNANTSVPAAPTVGATVVEVTPTTFIPSVSDVEAETVDPTPGDSVAVMNAEWLSCGPITSQNMASQQIEQHRRLPLTLSFLRTSPPRARAACKGFYLDGVRSSAVGTGSASWQLPGPDSHRQATTSIR